MTCARCGQPLRPTSRFCPSCGEPVRALPVRPPAAEASGSSAPTSAGSAPSPFSREAVPPPAPEPAAAPRDIAGQQPGPARWGPAYPGASRTVAELVNEVGNGLLGLIVVAVYGVLQVLFALVAAFNDNKPSKVAFVAVALPLVAVAVAATVLLLRRARERRADSQDLEVVHVLATGAGMLVSAYGLLLVLTALVSPDGSAPALL
jgi:hypothetical protein